MKPGSLVVYVGGQTPYDLECGYGLDPDAIYEVKMVGTRIMNFRKVNCVELVEMPKVSHMMSKFREVQPPGSVDIQALMTEPEPEKVRVKPMSPQTRPA